MGNEKRREVSVEGMERCSLRGKLSMVAELSFGVHRWLSCFYVTLTIITYRCDMRIFNLQASRIGELTCFINEKHYS